jgi:hypothetical protein
MEKIIGKIKERNVKVVGEHDIPEHFFPRENRYSPAKMFEVRVDGILRPIFIILPIDKAKPEDILKQVEIETAGEI